VQGVDDSKTMETELLAENAALKRRVAELESQVKAETHRSTLWR
jgi:hypothetical protein